MLLHKVLVLLRSVDRRLSRNLYRHGLWETGRRS